MSYNYPQIVSCIFEAFSMDFAEGFLEMKRKCRYLLFSVAHFTGLVTAGVTTGQTADVPIPFVVEISSNNLEVCLSY